MKRAINDPMHPGIASLLYRSGMNQWLRRRYPEPLRFREMRAAARTLFESGVIDFEQEAELRREIGRRAAADLLKTLRTAEAFRSRLSNIKELRKICPKGVSAYAFRMGRASVA